jgi:hypothetical protein
MMLTFVTGFGMFIKFVTELLPSMPLRTVANSHFVAVFSFCGEMSGLSTNKANLNINESEPLNKSHCRLVTVLLSWLLLLTDSNGTALPRDKQQPKSDDRIV